MNDMEYLEQRRADDEKAFLLKLTDPDVAPRYAPAFLAGRALLRSATRPVPHVELMATMARQSDVQIRSLENNLRKLCRHGFVRRTGEYSRRFVPRQGWSAADTRRYTIGDWPGDG